jgi:hypothetical protein
MAKKKKAAAKHKGVGYRIRAERSISGGTVLLYVPTISCDGFVSELVRDAFDLTPAEAFALGQELIRLSMVETAAPALDAASDIVEGIGKLKRFLSGF